MLINVEKILKETYKKSITRADLLRTINLQAILTSKKALPNAHGTVYLNNRPKRELIIECTHPLSTMTLSVKISSESRHSKPIKENSKKIQPFGKNMLNFDIIVLVGHFREQHKLWDYLLSGLSLVNTRLNGLLNTGLISGKAFLTNKNLKRSHLGCIRALTITKQ